MRIPLPCNFGDFAECNGKCMPLCGVSWFKWTQGMEYTYFFRRNDIWQEVDFYTTFDAGQPCEFLIPDGLLIDKPIKEHGFPLRGRGYAFGIDYRNEKLYVDFIITSTYLPHIKVQCDGNGEYIKGGDIIFPPSWDTEEKKKDAVLSAYRKLMDW